MMDVREKLVELLRDVQYLGGLEEKIADHLIANGVTVQEWIPVKNNTPTEASMNNADKIRSMTDDELNDLFHEIYDAGVDDAVAYECGQRTNSF